MPQLIRPREVVSLLMAFAPCFTGPSLHYFSQFVWVMMAGWGRRLATTVCRSDPVDKHHTNYARFLGRYRWEPATVAQALLDLLLSRLPRTAVGERLTVALDDRPVAKSRGKAPGLGWHHCHSKGQCAGPFVPGHVWMQIALAVRLGHEAFSLPLRALLYRRKPDCRRGAPYHEKWRLALELLTNLVWPHPVRIVADGNFYVRAFAHAIREAGHDLIVRLPRVAAVYRLPEPPAKRRRRPRTYGDKTTLEGAFRKARFRCLEETLWG